MRVFLQDLVDVCRCRRIQEEFLGDGDDGNGGGVDIQRRRLDDEVSRQPDQRQSERG